MQQQRMSYGRLATAVVTIWLASAAGRAVAQSGIPCPRYAVGSAVTEPPDLISHNGVLETAFLYQTRTDRNGNVLYCFMTPGGLQSPTLRVHPGDQIKLFLRNALPAPAASSTNGMAGMSMTGAAGSTCTSGVMTATSTNIHYHGTNTKPVCHQDEVIHTLVNSGETFEYLLQIPSDEPPGLYWYHPHVHGSSEAAVLGGASGALIVEGIENVNPAVAGLPQQVLVIRDNLVPGNPAPGGHVPSWDVSLNYIPVPWPAFTPAVITMKPSEKQFWRVLNASADTIIDLQLHYDSAVQPLEVVALDGVPTGSQDGSTQGATVTMNHILLAPAARAEFIVRGPSASVQNASLLTMNVATGPDGDNDPTRPLARIQTSGAAAEPPVITPAVSGPPPVERFAGLATATPTTQRRLYFSEVLSDPNDPNSPTNFFITVDGQTPVLFDPSNPPSIVTTQGAVEDWTIENRALENHEFHIHQIHFLLLEQNGVPVSADQAQYLDMVQVPYWSGTGPYPSVKVRMDFRGKITGDFVYHCHILGHEDNGMMAIIRVNPAQ